MNIIGSHCIFIVANEASDPTWKIIGIPLDLICFLTKNRMQILGQKLERNSLKKLVNAFLLLNAQFYSDFQILKTGIYRIIRQNWAFV